jgi:class 3 adenylate cyclase
LTIECPECHLDNPDDSKFCRRCATPLPSSFDFHDPQTKTIRKRRSEKPGLIAGKYVVHERLGRGGMGEVYKAQDIRLERTVAIKLLPPDLTDNPEARKRFVHEARTASFLDHPNICTVYEIDETEENRFYIAMAFCQGQTLKKRIKQGPLPLDEAVSVVIQVAQGLAQAHGKGIIHRDIKPSNIMIGDDGAVKIVDFGIAKLTGYEKITKTSEILGTVAYMSPEQTVGRSIDNRADLWSLGAVLYESLTGQSPFRRENEQSMMYAIVNESPLPPSELREDIPGDLERIIFRCLRKKKEDRYKDASHLLSDLIEFRQALEGEEAGPSAAKKSMPEKKETERRHATVLFVEISDYHVLLERLGEEETTSIMYGCLEKFGSIVKKYGGTIDEIMASSMKVLFGVPFAIEEASREAINAAIEMRKWLYRYNQEKDIQIPLDVHVGINTGMVITGAIGMDEKKGYTVLGDTVVLASQLKDLSERGKIYVGPATYKYTKDKFNFSRLKSLISKDRTQPVSVYVLLSTKEQIYRAGLGTERMIESEMVGRDKDLDELKLHVLKVINGEGSIVNVIGEAGIGKSRLIAELKRIEDIKKVTLLEGRALSIGRNLSYHPIIDFMKKWAHIREEDSETEALIKLEKTISNIDPEGTEEVFPFIATLMGMKLRGKHAFRIKGIEGEVLEKFILKSLRELMIKGSEIRPVVSIIEDLHWSDMSSIELFESLYRLAENHRILFINVFRPNYKETGDRMRESIKNRYEKRSSEIHLSPLNESQCEVLIRNLIKVSRIPANVQAAIVNRTEGNPFYIEEVVRSFIDDGVVEIKNGRFRVTEKIDSVVIPETIHEVLMTRIDRLDEKTKSLLKVASVIGRNFFYKILADVTKSIEEIDERLEFLKESQLILERRRREELEYLFKHALVQEVTYASILLKQRKELHLKIANSIESVFSEKLHEFYGMLALHYSQGEDLDKTEEYLIKAGEEALKTSASSEALYYYREALKIYLKKYGDKADPDKIAMLEKNIALALFNRGEFIEADGYFARVLTYYGVKFPKRKLLMLLKFFWGLMGFLFSLYIPALRRNRVPSKKDNEIINLFSKKVSGLTFLDPMRMFIETFYFLKKLINSDIARIENGIGLLSLSSAAFLNAGILFNMSRKILEFVKDKIDQTEVRSRLYYKVPKALLLTFTGDWKNLEDFDDELVEQSVRIGELFFSSVYILIQGYAKIEQGNFKESRRIVEILDDIADTYENEFSRAAYYWFRGQLLLKLRNFPEVIVFSNEGIEFTGKTGFKPYMFFLHAIKARAQILRGDMADAESTLQYSRKIRPEINLPPYFYSPYLLSELLFDLHRLEAAMKGEERSDSRKIRKKAYKTAKAAIRFSRRASADLAESYRIMGIYRWICGKQKKALAWFEKSVKVCEQFGGRLELARTCLEIGQKLSETQSRYHQLNGKDADEYLDNARVLFREMDLDWDLNELEKLSHS